MSKKQSILVLDLFSWSPSLTIELLETCSAKTINAKLITGHMRDAHKRESFKKYNVEYLSVENHGKIVKLLTLFINIKFIISECLKADKILLVWKTVLIYDSMLLVIFGKKIFYFEHNIIEHNRKNITIYDKVRWYLAKNIVFMSNYTFEKFNKLVPANNSNKLILQHPLIDQSKNVRPNVSKISDRVCFVGSSRSYRGLQRFVANIASKAIVKVDVFTSVDSSTEQLCNRYGNVHVSNGFLMSRDFVNKLQRYRLFVLPYLRSSQSGIFYSIIANDGIPIVTDTGDTAEKLRKFGLGELVFDLDAPDSFSKVVDFIMENKGEIDDKIQKLKTSIRSSYVDNISDILY